MKHFDLVLSWVLGRFSREGSLQTPPTPATARQLQRPGRSKSTLGFQSASWLACSSVSPRGADRDGLRQFDAIRVVRSLLFNDPVRRASVDRSTVWPNRADGPVAALPVSS